MLLASVPVKSQSADEILKRHVKAIGGEKALRAIQSLRLEGTASGGSAANTASDRPFLWMTRKPDLFYLEIRAPEGPIIEAYNGRTGWCEDPSGGVRSLPGPEQSRARATALFRNDHFLNYRKEKTRVRLLTRDTADGRQTYVLEMITRAGIQRRLWFDAASYLLLKEEQNRTDGREEIFYGDYRPVDGVLEPFHIVIRRGATIWDARVTIAKHNSEVEPAAFQFPSRSSTPLPDLPALLKEVEANQQNVEKLRENYTYTMEQTHLEVDSKGNLRNRGEATYEVFHLGAWRVSKLVARNGQPLSPEEARKEERRVEKIIRDWEAQQKKAAEKQARREGAAAAGRPSRDEDDDLSISDFLRVCTLQHPRWERFRGQEVLVFEFEPRPGYKARNRAESLVQKLTGTVWIDAKAREIARLEARLVDNFRIGAGLLASVGRGSAFVFEQERVRDEVWLPSYAEVNASARMLLFKGLKVNVVMRFRDYRKFNVETVTSVKPPAPPE